jgi:hypothetical protein
MEQGKRRRATTLAAGLTVAIDGLSILAFLLLLPGLVESFRRPSAGNGLFIIGSFVFFLIGIGSLRALQRGSSDRKKPRRGQRSGEKKQEEPGPGCTTWIAIFVLFGYMALITLVLGEVTGWFPSFSSETREVGLADFGFFVLAVLSTLAAYGIGCLAEPAPIESARGTVYQVLGVIGTDLMTLVTLAWYQSSMGDLGSADAGNPLGGKIVLFASFYLLFLVFYAPPRIYLFLANRDRIGLAVFLVCLAVYDWHLVSVMEM